MTKEGKESSTAETMKLGNCHRYRSRQGCELDVSQVPHNRKSCTSFFMCSQYSDPNATVCPLRLAGLKGLFSPLKHRGFSVYGRMKWMVAETG